MQIRQQIVELLLRGSEHSTVFHFLARLRRNSAVEELIGRSLPDIDTE